MFSGGKVTNSKPADPLLAISEFVRVVGDHVPSLASLQKIVKEAAKVGNTALRKASLGLQALTQPNNRKLAGMIHNAKAPQSIHPDRARVLGSVLGTLYQSPDSGARTLAVQIAGAWFREVANNIGIEGKYDNAKK